MHGVEELEHDDSFATPTIKGHLDTSFSSTPLDQILPSQSPTIMVDLAHFVCGPESSFENWKSLLEFWDTQFSAVDIPTLISNAPVSTMNERILVLASESKSKVWSPEQRDRYQRVYDFIKNTGHVPVSPNYTTTDLHRAERQYLIAHLSTRKPASSPTNTHAPTSSLPQSSDDELRQYMKEMALSITKLSSKNTEKEVSFSKLSVPDMKQFNGEMDKFYEWQLQAEHVISQAGFSKVLHDRTYASAHPKHNQHVFTILNGAIMLGTQSQLGVDHKDDGYALWHALKDAFFGDSKQSATVSKAARHKIDELYLDENTDADHYINEFKRALAILDYVGTPMSDFDKDYYFTEHITDPQYKALKTFFNNPPPGTTYTFQDKLNALRREYVSSTTDTNMLSLSKNPKRKFTSRRQPTQGNDDGSPPTKKHKDGKPGGRERKGKGSEGTPPKSPGQKNYIVPFVPQFLLDKVPSQYHWALHGLRNRLAVATSFKEATAPFGPTDAIARDKKNHPSRTRRHNTHRNPSSSQDTPATDSTSPLASTQATSQPTERPLTSHRLVRLHYNDVLDATLVPTPEVPSTATQASPQPPL